MDVSRHGFAPKRQIRYQEDLFWREDLIYLAVQIEQLRARTSPGCTTAMSDPLPAFHVPRVVPIQRHDFLVPALSLHLLFHVSIPPRLRRR